MKRPYTNLVLDWPAGGGRMAARIREGAWARTYLGPPRAWPTWLKTAVDVILRLGAPAAVSAGPPGILVYNDAAASIFERTRDLLGRPAADWTDNPDLAAHIIPKALKHGASAQQLVAVAPGSGDDETPHSFDLHCLPLRDQRGAPCGVLLLFNDATLRHAGERGERRGGPSSNDGGHHDGGSGEASTRETASYDVAGALADHDREDLRRQLAAAEERERRRLSRELHDQLGQHLTAISLGLADIARELEPTSAARMRLVSLQELTNLLTRDVRYLATELRPPELDDVGLESAIATYVEQWSTRYGIAAEVQAARMDGLADEGAATAVYRMLQEALTNVAKHSRARRVSVITELLDGELRLVVEDDGVGFDVDLAVLGATRARRLGLAGMRERAELARGTLTIESATGMGTTIFARIPARTPSPVTP